MSACNGEDSNGKASSSSGGGTSGGNTPPTAFAGGSVVAEVGRSVTLNGSGTDLDGDTLSYQWRLASMPSSSSASLQNATSETPAITPDVVGTYIAELVVNDGVYDSDPSSVSINAMIGNIAPTADAGPIQTVGLSTLVTLDGSDSSDPNGDTLSYNWTIVSRPSGSSVTLSNPGSVKPSFTTDVSGEYVIQLIVNDGEFDSMPSTTTVFAAAFSITLSWAANSDNPPGYVIYAGPTASTTNKLVRVLVKGASNWNPTSPSVSIDGGSIIEAIGTGASQACFAIKAYNGVGQSSASDTTCVAVPSP